MTPEILLSASILSADFANLGQAISEAQSAGIDWLHVDVMDGHFVPNLSMGPAHVAAFNRHTELPLDVHLMIDEPERYIPEFVRAGADLITVHVEATPNLHRALQMIRSAGRRSGVAINPGTPVSQIEPVLGMADLVLVMTVNPGYASQQFLDSSLSKVSQARSLLEAAGSSAYLEVDGGIDEATAPAAVDSGANVLVSASAIFQHSAGIAAGVRNLRDALA